MRSSWASMIERFQLWYGEGDLLLAAAWAEEVVAAIERQWNLIGAAGRMWQIVRLSDGCCLSIGVCSEGGVIYECSEDTATQFTTIGDRDALGVVEFDVGGELTEFERRHLINRELAAEVACEWVRGHGRSTKVEWTND